jgi:haloalkane dehalogenase
MTVLRTPAAHFENLPGWPYQPEYFTSTLYGMEVRIAYYDIGAPSAAETLVLTHGMSAWSYLNRRMVPPLVRAGHRFVLFDQVGCGQSDKPAHDDDYTYARHIGWNIDLLVNHLHLREATILLQDWGGILGLRVAAAHPETFRRLVIANTMLPTSNDDWFRVSPAFYAWKDFAFRTGLKDSSWIEERGGVWPGQIMSQKAVGPSNPEMSLEEQAAYGAPYPDDSYKAGARRFPELLPTPPSDPTGRPQFAEAENNSAAWAVFEKWTKPVLLAFSDEDTVMAGGDAIWKRHCPGTRHEGVRHVTIKGVGHFLQDGGAEQLVEAITGFIRNTPPSTILDIAAKRDVTAAELDDIQGAKTAAERAATAKADAHGSDSPWSAMATPWARKTGGP